MTDKYVICGIDTDCGKSIASILLYDYLKLKNDSEPFIIKPIQTGTTLDTDFYRSCGIGEAQIVNFYTFEAETSLHIASKLANKTLDLKQMISDFQKLFTLNRPLLFELAGGLLSPLDNQSTMMNLVEQLKIPVILIVSNSLGSINHALLTIHRLQAQALPIKGILYNFKEPQGYTKEHLQFISDTTKVPVLGSIPYLKHGSEELGNTMKKRTFIQRWKF